MKKQQTLVLIKPDGLKKSLTGNILTKLSETRLRIVGAKVVCVNEELAKKHYQHLTDKPFFEELKNYIMGKIHGKEYQRVLALVYQGENAITKVRELAGATNPEEAVSTSIRGAYGRITTKGVYENVIHTSGTLTEAEREIKLWFRPEEITTNLYPIVKTKDKIKWETSYDNVKL
ncbi:MAG: nucleoside-diphosphate kinase [Elusimicrobia bacterium]|jgi:nucleoside-diphosphate kinase|nr:nucleoside-diphosphate kinase [Elusimicrobiota bacterium]